MKVKKEYLELCYTRPTKPHPGGGVTNEPYTIVYDYDMEKLCGDTYTGAHFLSVLNFAWKNGFPWSISRWHEVNTLRSPSIARRIVEVD